MILLCGMRSDIKDKVPVSELQEMRTTRRSPVHEAQIRIAKWEAWKCAIRFRGCGIGYSHNDGVGKARKYNEKSQFRAFGPGWQGEGMGLQWWHMIHLLNRSSLSLEVFVQATLSSGHRVVGNGEWEEDETAIYGKALALERGGLKVFFSLLQDNILNVTNR